MPTQGEGWSDEVIDGRRAALVQRPQQPVRHSKRGAIVRSEGGLVLRVELGDRIAQVASLEMNGEVRPPIGRAPADDEVFDLESCRAARMLTKESESVSANGDRLESK